MGLKSLLMDFRYKTAKETPTLKNTIEKMGATKAEFDMAIHILKNYPETVSDEDMRWAQIYMLPHWSNDNYSTMRQKALEVLDVVLNSKFADDIKPDTLENYLNKACGQHDKEMVEKILEFPNAVNMQEDTFYRNSYFYITAEGDPRRHMYDERGSVCHRPEGSPDIVAVIEAFDIKRKAHQAQRANKPSVTHPKRP